MKSFSLTNLIMYIGLVMAISSCGDDEPVVPSAGKLKLSFQLQYDGKPLEMFTEYKYPSTDYSLYFSRVSYYLSNVQLHSGGTNTVVSNTSDYLNLTAAHTAPITQGGYIYTIDNVPNGTYDQLSFGFGVPDSLNAKEPKDFSSGSDLSLTSEYWGGWKSYIFFRPEGRIALNGEVEPNTPFALHLGANDAYTTIKMDKNIVVNGDEVVVPVIIDMKLFFDSKSLFDIKSNPQLHSLSQKNQVTLLARNLSGAVK